MEPFWIVVVQGLFGIIAAYITTQLTLRRSIGETLVVLQDRMNVLWDIYVKDALREARKAALVQENSPLTVTEEWHKLVPPELQGRLNKFIEGRTGTQNTILRETIKEFLNDLYLVAIENDVTIPALIGTLSVYIGENNK